jgi:DNA-binding MarR family transcriptional regulator
MTLEKDIKQSKAFKNPVERTIVNIMFTNNKIREMQHQILKNHDITYQQYNVLRILKGHLPEPITINGIIDRMLDKMSNASRLVDKLLQKGLVERTFRKDDRRACNVRLSSNGLDFLAKVNVDMDSKTSTINTLTNEEIESLNILLDKFRETCEK